MRLPISEHLRALAEAEKGIVRPQIMPLARCYRGNSPLAIQTLAYKRAERDGTNIDSARSETSPPKTGFLEHAGFVILGTEWSDMVSNQADTLPHRSF